VLALVHDDAPARDCEPSLAVGDLGSQLVETDDMFIDLEQGGNGNDLTVRSARATKMYVNEAMMLISTNGVLNQTVTYAYRNPA
jgi:hypothetical protein